MDHCEKVERIQGKRLQIYYVALLGIPKNKLGQENSSDKQPPTPSKNLGHFVLH